MTLGRALDPRANGAWLSKLANRMKHEVFFLGGHRRAKKDGKEARGNKEREKRED